jgi:hypothetical protein
MGFNTKGLTLFYKPWFPNSPVNAKKATGTLTFASTPVATDTITIGSEVYEVVTAAGNIAAPTNYAVVIGATPTADNVVVKLAAAINANSALVSAVASTPNDTVVVTSKIVGTEQNSIATTDVAVNASWGHAHLEGGQYATPCNASSALIVISDTIYYTDKPCTKFTEDAWYSCSATLIT